MELTYVSITYIFALRVICKKIVLKYFTTNYKNG